MNTGHRQMDALAVAQGEIERIMTVEHGGSMTPGSLKQTGVTEIIDAIKKSKHQWARHVASLYKTTGGPSEQQTGYSENR